MCSTDEIGRGATGGIGNVTDEAVAAAFGALRRAASNLDTSLKTGSLENTGGSGVVEVFSSSRIS